MLRENGDTEFKESYSKTILKDVVAFANTDGGSVFVGISDEGTVVGVVNTDEVQRQIVNSLKDSILPDVIPFINVETPEIGGKTVIKVSVAPGSEKPYFLRDKGLSPDGVFIRSGSSCQPLGLSGIRSMILASSGRSYEDGRSLIQDLTFNSFEREMKRRNLECGEPQMRTLHIIGADGLYTNLGLLVSDQCPYSIKVAVFQGKDKTVFRNRKEFFGSILDQLSEVYSFLDFYNGTKASFEGLYRTDKRDYPEDTLREALLNSIVHRDYSFNGSTLVNIFEDHIEFNSLGGLVPGLSLDAIMLGVSLSRNPNLAALFFRMEIVESYGTGIDKIMGLYKDCPNKPIFQTAEGAFRVVLYNRNGEPQKEEKKESAPLNRSKASRTGKAEILGYVEKNGTITRKDAEELLGVGTTHAYNILNDMCSEGLLVKEGAGRSSYYTSNE